MFERKESTFSTKLNPILQRRFESIAGIRRPVPLESRGLQQLASDLTPRPLHVLPEPDLRPYPDAA